ncbi:unnamed protein product [Clonostachys byssicola]|uniref:Uncharacterized protein n=1 Tax=Clonostachys byssicola TaxID=160290 RepID=A0A9N9UQB6_9HYPO|nr:unnamed protein product [Clonostachys byssicola]
MWARVLADACFEQLRGVGAMACCEMVECVSAAGTATHGIAIGSGPLALNSTPSPVDTLPAMSVGRPGLRQVYGGVDHGAIASGSRLTDAVERGKILLDIRYIREIKVTGAINYQKARVFNGRTTKEAVPTQAHAHMSVPGQVMYGCLRPER